MAAYSMDLRLRVLRDADAGLPSDELAEKYSVSRAWVDRLKQRRRETGEVAPRKQTRWRPRILHAQCSAPGFLDSGLTVFASMLPRPARRSHVAPERGFDSGTSLASTARCTSA